MLNVHFSKVKVFKHVIDSVKDIVTDASFKFTHDGMSMQAMDSSHVSLCKINLAKMFFERFEFIGPVSIGLNLQTIAKVLKCSNNDDSVKLKSSSEDLLTLEFQSKSHDKTMKFDVKLMDIDDEELSVPEKDYDFDIEMSSSEFCRIIRNLSNLGDICTIQISKNSLDFSVDGEIGEATIKVNNIQVKNAKETELKLTFAMRYLKLFTNASSLCNKVKLGMSSESPLMIQFELEENIGKIMYYLAPKMDESD
jgi:proliferating cell nuclear antigen